jgi:exodeoxyribonuclease V alpha subunit
MGVERADEENRQTTLCEKLQEAVYVKSDNIKEEGLPDDLPYEEMLMRTDPMIGMENISPYDFMMMD